MSIHIVYFSNYSGNTEKFVEKIKMPATRIPLDWNYENPLEVTQPYVLFVPTYGGGSESSAIPKQVRNFLNLHSNRDNLCGIVGFGNTNFGEHFCKAADMISSKTKVPIIGRVEIFGTDHDIEKIKERLELLYGN
jgi:protein involved in ribonucleotide reduction